MSFRIALDNERRRFVRVRRRTTDQTDAHDDSPFRFVRRLFLGRLSKRR